MNKVFMLTVTLSLTRRSASIEPMVNYDPNQPQMWWNQVQPPIERRARIGSEDINISDMPFVVALVLAQGKRLGSITGGIPFCSGSIIDEKWVLTAAHCSTNTPLSLMRVVAGCDTSENVKLTNEGGLAGCAARSFTQIVIHPKFVEGKPSKYDVAVIEVEKPFEFGPRINKIDLWNSSWETVPKPHPYEYGVMECRAAGWGMVENEADSPHLKSEQLTIQHGTDACACFEMYQQRRLLCSATLHRSGICPGDSGGPLVCHGKLAGVAHLIFHEEMCTRHIFGPKLKLSCNGPKVIGAWIYVCPMLSFIHNVVPNTPAQPTTCHSPPLTASHFLVVALVSTRGLTKQ